MNLGDVFVGREDLIRELAACLPSQQGWLAEAIGVAGIGKTRLLERLRERLPSESDCLILHISMEHFVPGWSASEQLTLEGLSINFNELCSLLGALADQIGHRSFDDFMNKIRIARNKERGIQIEVSPKLIVQGRRNQCPSVEDVQNTDIRIDSAVYFQQIDALRVELVDEFVDRMNRLTERRPALWTADSFEVLDGHPLQDWFIKLASQLDRSVVVIARTPSPAGLRAGRTNRLERPLTPLSDTEVAAFVGGSLAGRQLPPSLPHAIYEFSGGHPQTVVLATELLLQRYSELEDLEHFAEDLKRLPSDVERRHANMALQIVRDAHEADLEQVALACSVVRRFDTPLLEALLKGTVPYLRCRELVSRLESYSFTEHCRAPGENGDYYRLHGFIRGGLVSHLRRTDPDYLNELNRRAADHYYGLIKGWEEATEPGADSYTAWYRYEDPRWQAYKLEWVYHQAQLARQDTGFRTKALQQQARLRLARVFLDAFWWWGCYIDFPFCRRLLDDWASSQVDVEWLNELSEVLVSHPPGSSMQGTADWSRVAAALRRLRVACGISGPPSTLKEEDQRHCRALTDIFCARACRYRDAVSAQERAEFDAEADNLYRQAATLLSTDGDQWGLAWVHLELAEFWHQGRQEQKGLENWNLAAALNIKWQFQDEELIASLQRVSGDLYCARQEWSAAFAAYGRAVLHAYLFQNRPHPPDWYTLQFYRDTTEWTLERLAEFAEQGLMTQAVEYALAVRRALPAIAVARVVPTPQAIEGLLTTRKFDALRMFLFPTAPTVDELGDARSSFIDIWEEAVEDLGAEVADDL